MVMEGQGRGMCRDTILSLRGNALHPVVGLISLARSVVWGYAGEGPLAGLALSPIRANPQFSRYREPSQKEASRGNERDLLSQC